MKAREEKLEVYTLEQIKNELPGKQGASRRDSSEVELKCELTKNKIVFSR